MLADWLFEWIEKNQESSKTRAFSMAVSQATSQTASSMNTTAPSYNPPPLRSNQQPSRDLRSLISKKTEQRLGSMAQRTERQVDRSAPYTRKIPKTKCTFYPNCTRSDCQFFHPTELCGDGANCSKGAACLYIHEKSQTEKCKFGEHCNNPECTFSHPSPAAAALKASATIQCRYAADCRNSGCSFSHPPINAAPNLHSALSSSGETICKFDPHCTRAGCYFNHPSRTTGATSQRSFALVNADTKNDPKDGMELDI